MRRTKNSRNHNESASMVILYLPVEFFPIGVDAQEQYSVAYFDLPPHIIVDKDSLHISGALYDFLNEDIAPAMGIEFVWDKMPTNIPRQAELLKNDERDIAALMAVTPQRSELFEFSATHYFESKPSIAVLKENPLNRVKSIDDILGLTVGYATQAFRTPFMRDERIRFEFIASAESTKLNFLKLTHDRVDAVYAPDKASLLMEIKQEQLQDKVKILALPEPGSLSHLVFAKKHAALAERYNKAFISVGGRKKYLQRLNKYLDSSQL